MAKNLKLQLSFLAKDSASPIIKKLSDNVIKSEKQMLAIKKRSQKQQEMAIKRGMTAHKQAISARARLGVRSENQIQREIKQTQAAYNRLARSGKASANDLTRAYSKMTNKVKGLNKELGYVSKKQKMIGRAKVSAGVIAAVGAGAMIGARMIAEPAKKQMSYDRKLAHVSNTAFSERDAKGRIKGKSELEKSVKNAVNIGGGSKDQALDALDTLLASGTVKTKIAMDLLPTLQKASVATGASTQDLSKIAISAMQQFGISEKDIGKVLDKAVAAGQAGNFELNDMARWLPAQMAAAVSAGMSGMNGFDALLVANQQARVTASSSDQAGNNLVNLLAKLTSKETNDRLAKTKHKGNDGIDFIGSMHKAKTEGKDPIQAFVGIIDKIIGSDKRYQKLQNELKTGKKGDSQRIAQEMSKLMEGSAIGKVISDRQALMALVGIRNNKNLGEKVKKQVSNSQGAVDTSFKVISSTNDFKTEQLGNTKDFAEMESVKGLNDALGDVSTKLVEYAKQYPDLTSYISDATLAVKGIAPTAIAAAVALKMLGGKGAVAATTAATTVGATTTAAKAKKGARLQKGIKGSVWLSMLLLGGSSDKSLSNNSTYSDKRKNDLDYLSTMISSLEVHKGKAVFTDRAKQYKQDLVSHPDSDIKTQLINRLDSLLINSKTSNDLSLKSLSEITNDFKATSDITNQALQAMANKEVSINTNNQIFLDGSLISEQVTTHQTKMSDRGE